MTGWVPDVKPYMAGAKVFIMPFRVGSGTRLKLIEAMAAGRAIVSTQGATREMLDEIVLDDRLQLSGNVSMSAVDSEPVRGAAVRGHNPLVKRGSRLDPPR